MDEDEIHIAVGKNSRKEEPNILWAAANFPMATIVLVHVHWPSKWIPFSFLNRYLFLQVSAYYLTHHDIIAGVVLLVKKLKIKRIVIGSRSELDLLIRENRHLDISGNDSINPIFLKYSNGHVEHNRNFGYGGSMHIFDSICERSKKCREDETLTGKKTDKSMENFYEEGEDAAKIMVKEEIDKLQKKLKELQGEGNNHGENNLLPSKIAASPKKSLSEPRYPELKVPEHIDQFSMLQICKATRNFHSENLIGGGGYGPVYKGNIGGMPVAIKLLRPHGRQGFPEYQQEVVVLSRLEHSNIVRLIGVCQESCSLVYEHLPNGTLQDRLSNGLPWEDRVRILAEQRSALKYLHSCRPNAIIHGDLKLTNILLDTGDVSRLGDFGTARVVHVKPLEEETIVRRTNPMGTMGYIDPVFFTTGELTTESDVYSFGVVIMQLLTGLESLNIAEQVRGAVKMHSVLDASAGPWPEVEAERLLKLALRCCSLERKQRPAITSDAEWKPLKILRDKAAPAVHKTWKWNCFAS
ncbi:U-box domain-containing protein 33 [Dichanthelium oligosanthes]|uniref:RING-type E3 ubiquitin transferase n=1 Tax=Dichanthelium oligosanthes TaxID=888268 RepID=A0A1E5UQ16_9POAL|nr:U-box domain-containing protein 33 [Dichanthelium oligosanthes]